MSTGIFSIEYLLRLWSCVEDERYHGAVLGRCVASYYRCSKHLVSLTNSRNARPLRRRVKWMVKPLSLIDLAALVPFYLEICIQCVSCRLA